MYDLVGETTDRCPLALMKQKTVQEVASLFRAYEAGHLPRAGGLSDQSMFYRSCISYAAQCRDEAEEYNRKRQAEADKRKQ